jgi:hypothetical protein
MNQDYGVAIIGGGLSGSSAAWDRVSSIWSGRKYLPRDFSSATFDETFSNHRAIY